MMPREDGIIFRDIAGKLAVIHIESSAAVGVGITSIG